MAKFKVRVSELKPLADVNADPDGDSGFSSDNCDNPPCQTDVLKLAADHDPQGDVRKPNLSPLSD
jgi:hypothetical protein